MARCRRNRVRAVGAFRRGSGCCRGDRPSYGGCADVVLAVRRGRMVVGGPSRRHSYAWRRSCRRYRLWTIDLARHVTRGDTPGHWSCPALRQPLVDSDCSARPLCQSPARVYRSPSTPWKARHCVKAHRNANSEPRRASPARAVRRIRTAEVHPVSRRDSLDRRSWPALNTAGRRQSTGSSRARSSPSASSASVRRPSPA
jgi:hypothetical protein